jgi:hypothetical protein
MITLADLPSTARGGSSVLRRARAQTHRAQPRSHEGSRGILHRVRIDAGHDASDGVLVAAGVRTGVGRSVVRL